MIVKQNEINAWESEYRLNFIHALSGYKGVHLIGTKSESGQAHLAVFNSLVHISSVPVRIGFISRQNAEEQDTHKNILETKYFTVNHVHKAFLEQAHFTAAGFTSEESVFDVCNLTESYLESFHAPFVGESKIKMGLKLVEDIELSESGCRLIVGEIQLIEAEKDLVEASGLLDLEKANDICLTGLNQYSSVKKFKNIQSPTRGNMPNFNRKKRPDSVVFDEETQSYNASILPYGTNIGSPSIRTNDLSTWKNRGINSFNHVLKSKIEGIKEAYNALIETYEINELLYNSQYEFEPIIGEVYHLYEKDNTNENFLSMVPPHTWKRKHLGSFKLSSEKVWIEIKNDNDRPKEGVAPRNF